MPPFPEGMEDLWGWALELDATRSMGQYGPQVTSYTEMKAWAELTDRDLDAVEVSVLVQLDRVLCYPGDPTKDDADDNG